jgi:hypothetical protein
MAELRQSIQKANDALISAISKFGETSAEAQEAARQVANYREQMNAANQLTQVMNPAQPFANLLGTLQGVTGGIAAVQGAMALFGGESEAVEQVLLKVNAAMALASGITAIKEAAPAFTAMNTAATTAFNSIKASIGATGIGLLIVAIGALVMNFDKLKNSVTKVDIKQQALNDTVDDYKKGAQDAITETMEMRQNFDLARKGLISKEEALKNYNDNLGDTFGAAKDLNEAERLFVAKTDAYIKSAALRAQADAILKKAAEEQANALIAGMQEQQNLSQDISSGILKDVGFSDKELKGIQENQKKRAEQSKIQSEKNSQELGKLASDLMTQAAELDKQNGLTNKKQRDDSDKTVKKKEENNKKEKDNNDDKLKQIEEANAQSRERERQLEEEAFLLSIQDEKKRSQAKLLLDFENQRREINQSKAIQEQKNKELAALDEKYRLENEAIEKEYEEKKRIMLEEEAEKSLQAMIKDLEQKAQEQEKARQEQIERDKIELETRTTLRNAYFEAGSAAIGILKDFAGKNKALQKAALIAENAITIARIILDTQKANAAVTAKYALIPGGQVFAVREILANKIKAGIGIATAVAATAKGLQGIGAGGGGATGGSVGGAAGGGTEAPIPVQASTTMLDQNQVNQMASATARAFVVESDVSGNQERIRRLNRAARIN